MWVGQFDVFSYVCQLILSIRSVNSVCINLSSISSMCLGSSVNEWMGESSSPMSSITASSLGSVMPFIRIQIPSSVRSAIQGFDLSHSLILSEFRTFSDFRQFFDFSQSVQCEQFVSCLNSFSNLSMLIHRVRQGFCWVQSAILMTSAIYPVRALASVTE